MLWGCPNFFNKTDRCTYTKSRSATTSEPAAADEPDATKANTTDMNTMRRMLVRILSFWRFSDEVLKAPLEF